MFMLETHPSRFLFIDFNSYFAAVEQHDDPALAGKPVIVTPLESEHTGAIAASYEAKALGIGRGTTVREARALCPGIAVRPARHERYVEMHGRLMEEIGRHLPIARIYSIDECACRLDRREYEPGAALRKAEAIKRGIAQTIGPCLRSSIGIAPSPLLAKLAAELEKPDGLVLIRAEDLPEALADLPLRAIPGVGGGMAARLERANVTFTDLWQLAPKQARAIWGSVVGERFLYSLKGHDIPDDAPREKTMIGHSRVLSPQHQAPCEARVVARALLLKAASRLRLYDLHASRLRLGFRLRRPDGYVDSECVFPPTQNSWRFLRELNGLWDEGIRRVRGFPSWNGRIAFVSIDLHGLQRGGPQPDLFTPASVTDTDAREASLWTTIGNLNRQYERQVVTLASQRGLDLNYLGVKIAFSRVPDAAEFHC